MGINIEKKKEREIPTEKFNEEFRKALAARLGPAAADEIVQLVNTLKRPYDVLSSLVERLLEHPVETSIELTKAMLAITDVQNAQKAIQKAKESGSRKDLNEAAEATNRAIMNLILTYSTFLVGGTIKAVKASESVAKGAKSIERASQVAKQVAKTEVDLVKESEFLAKWAEIAKEAKATKFVGMRSLEEIRSTFSRPTVASEINRLSATEGLGYIANIIFDPAEINKMSKSQRVLAELYMNLGKEGMEASLKKAVKEFIEAGGTLNEAKEFTAAFTARFHMAGNTILMPWVRIRPDSELFLDLAHKFRNTSQLVRGVNELLLKEIENSIKAAGKL